MGGLGYYLVVETEQGHAVVTEMLQDGSTTWVESPAELEVRSSLAKVFCSERPSQGASVGTVEAFCKAEARSLCTTSRRKRFAFDAYAKAGGRPVEPLGGLKVLRQGKTATTLK